MTLACENFILYVCESFNFKISPFFMEWKYFIVETKHVNIVTIIGEWFILNFVEETRFLNKSWTGWTGMSMPKRKWNMNE